MNRHVMKIRLLAKKILLILLSIMRHGLLLFVMSFNIIEWEMLKISNFFFFTVPGQLIYFIDSSVWMVLIIYQLLLCSHLQNFVSQDWRTWMHVYCSPTALKRENKNVEIKCSYSFSIFETFPEPCCAPAGRMSPDVKDICLFCTFTAILQALHLQPSGHDKIATGEQAKPRAGCQKELFKVNAQVAEKLNILSGVCLSGKNPNQSSLLRKP